MERGRFLVLEGGDGSGKSTQVALLSRWMHDHGVDHVATREPGGTPLGEALRAVLLDRRDLDMPAESELFLYLAARAVFVRDVVEPALAAGRLVLADRFSLSTLAYQGYGRGLDLAEVRSAIALATRGLEPDLTLMLDVSVAEGAARRGRTGLEPDRMEGQGAGFLDRVHEGYGALARTEPDVVTIQASAPPDEVHRRILEALASALPETFAPRAV